MTTADETSADKTTVVSDGTMADETTYIKAVHQIQSKIENASLAKVHIYSFNIPSNQLDKAIILLDKQPGRGAMRVTFSPCHNFVIKYMPGRPHEEAIRIWDILLFSALSHLTNPPQLLAPGCKPIGTTTFDLGPGKKEADSGIRPSGSPLPRVVLEVGDSESLSQLRNDAKCWLEHMHEVQLVVVISIDRPNIIIELWRGFPPSCPPRSAAARDREGRMVWDRDWTNNATQLYILLSDIFGGQVPAAYGNNDWVSLDSVCLRQSIIDSW